MKRIKITKDFKDELLKDFKAYLNKLEPGKKIEYTFKEDNKNTEKPKVILSQKAYIKIKTLVAKADGEIGWNGSVTRNGNTFTVEDIFVYPQKVTGATVTCDEVETAQWLMSLPTETFNKLRFQAHSHVNMGISPSGVDTTMYEKYLQNLGDDDFYIFMIFNKKDDYYIELNDNKTNIIYYKSDIDVSIEGTDEYWESVKGNVKTFQAQPQTTTQTKIIEYPNKDPEPSYKNCKKDQCRDCENFYECAEEWYKLKLKESK